MRHSEQATAPAVLAQASEMDGSKSESLGAAPQGKGPLDRGHGCGLDKRGVAGVSAFWRKLYGITCEKKSLLIFVVSRGIRC